MFNLGVILNRPNNVPEPQIENVVIPATEVAKWKWMMVCVLCVLVGMMLIG